MSKFTNRMKKAFSLKEPQAPEPRPKDTLSKEYSQLVNKAGQTQYLVYVYTKELDQLNQQMLALNQEAAKRDDLEKQENKEKELANA